MEQEKNHQQKGNGNKPSGFVFLGKASEPGSSSSSTFAGGLSLMVCGAGPPGAGSKLSRRRDLSGNYDELFMDVLQNDKTAIQENFIGTAVPQQGETAILENFIGMAVPDFARRVLDQFKEKENREIFLSLPPGHAIIDPGAGQDLIGRPAYEQLRAKLATVGLRPQPIDEEPPRASGIGGQATTLFMALIPTILGGAPGVVRVTVVLEDIPHLLSIGLLESAGSVIDTKANVIRFEEHGTEDKMLRLKSGHRTVDVTKWDGGLFPVPPQVREQYGLSEGAFNLHGATAKESYMERAADVEEWHEVSGTPFVFKVHATPRSTLYQPSGAEATGLSGMRVSFAQFSDGSVRHVQDDWRDGSEELSKKWIGVSVFCRLENDQRTFLSQPPNRQPQGSNFPCVSTDCDQPPAGDLSDASVHCRAMASSSGRHPGQGEGQGSRKSRRLDPVPSSGEVRGERPESIWNMEALPEMQDELPVHGIQPAHGQGEGQEHRVCEGEELRRHGGGSSGTTQEREDNSSCCDGVRVFGHEGNAGGSHPVQPAAVSWHDFSDVPGDHAVGDGSADSPGDDAAVHGEPDHDDADRSAGSELHGRDDERDVSATPTEPGRGGVGSSGESSESSTSVVRMDVVTTPRVSLRPTECMYLGRAKSRNYITEEGEVMVAWEMEDLHNYLNDEDIIDDYEVGVTGGVKRATRRIVGEALGINREAPTPSQESLTDPEPSENSLAADSETNSEFSSMLSQERKFKIMELFSPPRVTKEIREGSYPLLQTTEPPAFDLQEGWDFFDAKDRKRFWDTLEEEDPDLVLMTPECRGFSTLMQVNWERMDKDSRKKLQTSAMAMFHFSVQVAERQLRRGKYFVLEQPDKASSWNTHAAQWLQKQDDVMLLSFDQCMTGLQVSEEGLSQKRTSFMLNHEGIAVTMAEVQCDKGHEHVRLENGLPRLAQVWPRGLVKKVIEGMLKHLKWSGIYMAEDEDEEAEEDDVHAEDELDYDQSMPEGRNEEERPLSREEKEMVKRLHVNLGHLPTDRMLMMLKAANAKPKVLQFVRDEMACDICMRQHREVGRRRAAFPRTFEFNKIVGLDVFYLKWGGRKIPFLNVVDHGSNFQAVSLVRPEKGGDPSGGNPSASEVWKSFLSSWIRPHGAPEAALTDGGMEFRGRFERGLEQFAVLQNVTDIQSPWQNGRVERHGQWVKDRVELELSAGSQVLETLEDLENLIMELVACKNCWVF